MAWSPDLHAEVRAEFRSAQRRARGVIERASDEPEPKRLAEAFEKVAAWPGRVGQGKAGHGRSKRNSINTETSNA